ncbi:MAG: alpha-galactosidase [Spirochaetaceae bacterium]|jgi:alpha-galactosidase|nr:alpha-galactosidase [Spirochaetaceae bacterium]
METRKHLVVTFRFTPDTPQKNVIPLASWSYGELAALASLGGEDGALFTQGRDVAVHAGGWQSWSGGWELSESEAQSHRVLLLTSLLKLTAREGETPEDGEVSAHFVTYLRAGDTYLCLLARTHSPEDGAPLPPVNFRFHRKDRRVSAEVFCPGKVWQTGELLAEITLFARQGYFAFKDALKAEFAQDFSGLGFLRSSWKGGVIGGYESWYNHYTNIDEELILEDLSGLSTTGNLLKGMFIDTRQPLVFQIDDGWEVCVGQWDPHPKRFPRGLAALAERIEGAGFIPGLWVAPLLVTKRAAVFRERAEWVLRDAKGRPVVAGWNPRWDGAYYCLDISRRDVRDYLAGVIETVIAWGFRYLKLDFLYAGYLLGKPSGEGALHENFERLCSLLTAVRTTPSGLPVAYLGCGAPLGPSSRHFPLMRTGADTLEKWDWNAAKLLGHAGRPSAYINLLDTIGRSFLDNTVFCSDPDVVFTRSVNCKLTEQEKELIAVVNFLLAGQIMFSDDPLRLSEADLAFTGRLLSLYERLSRDDYGAQRLDKDVYRILSRSGAIGGIINLSDAPYPAGEFQGSTFILDRRVNGAFPPHTVSVTAQTH